MTTVAELHTAYREGVATPEEVAERFLAASRQDGPLGAFRSVRPDDVRAQAQESTARLAARQPLGPLEGVLVGVKEVLAVRGHRTFAGTAGVAFGTGDRDAEVVARLRAAGAIIAGTTHCTELGLSPLGNNTACGTPRNPHAVDHLPGGSSSGTAVAVAGGLVGAGVGSDGGGSVRIPAALCGVFGLKPSWQLVPGTGSAPIGWWSLDHVGPIARCTEDLATMLAVMADVRLDQPAPVLRWGVDWDWWGRPDPRVDAACRSVVAEVAPTAVTVADLELAQVAGYLTALTELAAGVHELLRDRPAAVSVDVRAAVDQAGAISGVDYIRAQQVRTRLAEAFTRVFSQVDVLVVPTTGVPAPPRPPERELAGGVLDADLIAAVTTTTFPANLCGLPAASVPVGTSPEGLPIGLQVVGARGADATVLAACAELEAAGLAARPHPTIHHATLI